MSPLLRGMLAVVIATGGVAACDPVVTLRTSARSATSCASPASSAYDEAPAVADAEVLLHCPDHADLPLGKTDATGQLAVHYVGLMETQCSVTVRKDGYEPRTFAIDDVCVGRRSSTYCYGAVITADLSPRAGQR